ncbi:diguanylate cyclase [Marinicella rhabdoformis]|uniref:diguanylate cyclase n=1 Tax=Marinicella rhabdoformis TaxID=2580566 RepID=UPI0012AEB568
MDKDLIHTKRTAKENLVIGVCAAYGICISFFAIIRFISQDWVIGTVDSILVLFSFYVGYHVYSTRQTLMASHAMAVIAVLGTLASIVLKGSVQIYWVYPTAILVYYLIPPKTASYFSLVFMALVAYLVRDLPAFTYITTLMSILVTVYFSYLFSIQSIASHEKLKIMATEDMLTGIGNRRAFYEMIEKIRLNSLSASAIVIDVDNFKKVNDLLGYQKGDDILNDTVDIIDCQVADDDILYRLGGAKFILICQNKDFDYAYKAAQRIRCAFNESHLYQSNGVSLSMGVARKTAQDSTSEWIKQLNSAVFKAKKTGKDRIIKAINY